MSNAIMNVDFHNRDHIPATRYRVFLFLILLSCCFGKPAFAYPPVFVLGLYGDDLLYPEESGRLENLGNVELKGLMGYRTSFEEGGYLSLNTGVSVNDYFDDLAELNDNETFQLELTIPVWDSNRFVFDSGFDSSLLGTLNRSPYFNPAWEMRWHFGEISSEVQPFIAYQGFYLMLPSDDDDAFFEGGELGLLLVPSVTIEVELAVGVGWEGWYEYPIYDSGGNVTDSSRHDIVIQLAGEVRGMLEYFTDYTLGISGVVRVSNANRYLPATVELDDNSETRLELSEKAGLQWSPNRYLDLQGNIFATQELYFDREALNDNSSPVGELLRVYLVGGEIKVDWTPNDVVFFIFNTTGGYSFANDPDEDYWYINFRIGIEMSY